MARFDSPGDERDQLAADRDDAADQRDLASSRRDVEADRRDAWAGRRDVEADDQAVRLDRRLDRVRHQILDRLGHLADLTLDEAEWPDLTPAALARLQAFVDEQRRLAALDHVAISDLFDDLLTAFRHGQADRSESTRDRLAANRDRSAARADREYSAHDRSASWQDRDQAAIERQQVDAPDGPGRGAEAADACPDEPAGERAGPLLARSRQRRADSRARVTRSPGPPTGGSTEPDRP